MNCSNLDMTLGSVVLGWRGPSLADFDTNVALEILIRYLAVCILIWLISGLGRQPFAAVAGIR